MPEPTDDPFATFDPEVAVPSPADIRRRGDRLRRRNTALAVVGGVAAVAVIATPLALLTGGGSSSAPPATSTPSVTQPATPAPSPTDQATSVSVLIPDGFPLADQLPETNGDGTPVTTTGEPAITKLEQCGVTLWTRRGPAAPTEAVAGASYVGEAEDSRTRTLALYGSEEDARAALQRIRTGLLDCPVESDAGSDRVYEEVSSTGNESVFTLRYRTDGVFDPGLEVLQLHRENNAVLLATYYGEGGGSAATIASAVDLAGTESMGVYAAMTQAYGAGGAAASGSADDVPAGFPLTSGWPDSDGVEGPGTDLENTGVDLSACDVSPREPQPDPLAASWSQAPDYHFRALYTFPDADAAASWVEDTQALYETCRGVERDEQVPAREVRDTQVGGQSFATAFDGPASNRPLHVLQVVRLGRGVLLDYVTTDEGADVTQQLATMDGDAAGVVAAMCVFTEAGC